MGAAWPLGICTRTVWLSEVIVSRGEVDPAMAIKGRTATSGRVASKILPEVNRKAAIAQAGFRLTKRCLAAQCRHAFFDQVTLNFPKSQRRKQEPVDSSILGRFIPIHLRPPYFRTFARLLSSAFGFQSSPASVPSSFCSHQYSLLMNTFCS